jgi:hypothetical protein
MRPSPWTRCRPGLAAALALLAGASALLAAAAVRAQQAAPSATLVPFMVFAADGKSPLYRGEYRIERSGGKISESQRYQTADGKLAKLDESVYDTERRRPVSFYSANYLTGDIFRLAVSGNALSWRSEDAAGGLKASDEDTLPSGTFVWPNLPYVLAQEWAKLAQGESVSVDLYVVSRKMKVGLDLKPEGKVDVGGNPGLHVRIEPSSLLFRQVAGEAWMTLAVEPPHHLLRFEGKGAIRGADGKDVSTVIVFDWAVAQAAPVPAIQCPAPPCPAAPATVK